MKHEKGFTFIEIILVVAIMITIGALAASLSGNFFFGRGADITLETLRSNIREAQLFSLEGKNGSEWGVALRNGSIVFFQGLNYDSRDSGFDMAYDVPYGVTVSGFDEVIAERGTGVISGTITGLQIAGFGETYDFSFSEEGGFIQE